MINASGLDHSGPVSLVGESWTRLRSEKQVRSRFVCFGEGQRVAKQRWVLAVDSWGGKTPMEFSDSQLWQVCE